MNKTRLEAFSDGVIAILLTIMVLELKIPEGHTWEALRPLVPIFLTYVMSFVYLAIYWNNHHHLLHATDHVDGRILWANLHLLFWLSLIPFVTGWMDENHFAMVPTALYGVVLLCAGLAYFILTQTIIRHCDANQDLREVLQGDRKGKISLLLYMLGVATTFAHPLLGIGIYVFVALMWLVPDRRIERNLGHRHAR